MTSTAKPGIELLHDPSLNKLTGFTEAEKQSLGLVGLVPDVTESIETQLSRVLLQLKEKATDLDRFKVARLAMLGTSRLRCTLRTSNYPRDYMEQMGAVVALVGRLVDIAASLTHIDIQTRSDDRPRIRALATSIGSIRADLLSGKAPGAIGLNGASEPAGGGVPLLREMEKTVLLIPAAFSSDGSISELGFSPSDDKRLSTFLAPDAFSNLDHLKFGLKGGLTASLCYIIYNALAWPGISTAVTTCLLTALSTVGFSRQKQILRFAGAIVGGFLFGMGAQIVILPHLDSIAKGLIMSLDNETFAWACSLRRMSETCYRKP